MNPGIHSEVVAGLLWQFLKHFVPPNGGINIHNIHHHSHQLHVLQQGHRHFNILEFWIVEAFGSNFQNDSGKALSWSNERMRCKHHFSVRAKFIKQSLQHSHITQMCSPCLLWIPQNTFTSAVNTVTAIVVVCSQQGSVFSRRAELLMGQKKHRAVAECHCCFS